MKEAVGNLGFSDVLKSSAVFFVSQGNVCRQRSGLRNNTNTERKRKIRFRMEDATYCLKTKPC